MPARGSSLVLKLAAYAYLARFLSPARLGLLRAFPADSLRYWSYPHFEWHHIFPAMSYPVANSIFISTLVNCPGLMTFFQALGRLKKLFSVRSVLHPLEEENFSRQPALFNSRSLSAKLIPCHGSALMESPSPKGGAMVINVSFRRLRTASAHPSRYTSTC